MNIYMLDVKLRDSDYFNIKNAYANVYITLNEAIERGKIWLKASIQELYYGKDYQYGNDKKYENTEILELRKMMHHIGIVYEFTVKETDLEYAKGFKLPKYEYECRNLEPTSKTYSFNLEGELQNINLTYMDSSTSQFYSFFRYPRR